MDGASKHVVAFLEALQNARERLDAIWGYYLKRGVHPGRPFLSLSGRPFTTHEARTDRQFVGSVTIGLPMKGSDDREYELTVNILWDDQGWTIMTEAWVEADEGGQHFLRGLSERTASDLSACIAHIHAAVEDLVHFEDLIPRK